jgi:hypothetical protein
VTEESTLLETEVIDATSEIGDVKAGMELEKDV